MNELFGLTKFLYVLANPILVTESFFPVRFRAFIDQMDFQTLFRNASSRNRVARISNLNSVVIVNISGSGKNVIRVPEYFLFWTSPMTSSLRVVLPRENAIR